MKKQTTLIISIIITFLSLLTISAFAQTNNSSDNGTFSVELESRDGSLPVFYHEGYAYVEGYNNQQYSIRIYNDSANRVEAVVTVDGRDVINGTVGNYRKNRGYIINPYSSILIDGFRKSSTSVAGFYFTDAHNSYSARMGTPENAGVIGVVVFKEKIKRHPRPVYIMQPPDRRLYTDSKQFQNKAKTPSFKKSDALASSYSQKRYGATTQTREHVQQQIGTGYGAENYSPSAKTSFKRKSRRPSDKMTIYYDNHAGLVAKGIIPDRTCPQPYPNPFPHNNDPQYAPPPPVLYRR